MLERNHKNWFINNQNINLKQFAISKQIIEKLKLNKNYIILQILRPMIFFNKDILKNMFVFECSSAEIPTL